MRSRSREALLVAWAIAGCGAPAAPPPGGATATVPAASARVAAAPATPSGSAPAAPSGSAPAAPSEAPATPAFAAAWPEIHGLLRAGRAEALVDPGFGLVVLDNPGAFITVTAHPTFAAGVAALAAPPALAACELRAAALPQYSCETDRYSVPGCILTDPSHPRLLFLYDAYVRHALAPGTTADPAMVARLRRAEERATATVSDTSRHTRWHFGVVDGRWRLLVVDVVVPCSA